MLFIQLVVAGVVALSNLTTVPTTKAIVTGTVEVEQDPYAGLPKETADMYRMIDTMMNGVINGTDV